MTGSNKLKNSAGYLAFACALLAGTASPRAAEVTYERLVHPEPHTRAASERKSRPVRAAEPR